MSHWRIFSSVLRRIWDQMQSDDCFDMAAEMSFYFLLSLLPFFLVLAVLVQWLPSTKLWEAFATWMVAYLPVDSRRMVFSIILGLSNGSTGLLSFGLVTTLWSASSGFVSLMESLSVAYGSRDSRSFWRKRALAACVTVLAGIFILVCFALMAISHLGFDKISPLKALNLPHAGWKIGSWIVTVALLCLGVNLINFVLPDVKRTWHWVTSGTAFAVLALIISSAAMNVYVKYFPSMDRIYGTLVGFIVLMLWIYVGSLILLLAAEIDHEIEKFI